MAITASEARKNLFPLIEQVNDDHTPVEITSRRGSAVLMSREDYDALQETAYLLQRPRQRASAPGEPPAGTPGPARGARPPVVVRVVLTPHGWDDHVHWQTPTATPSSVNRLIDDARRDPFAGIGRPEQLRHALSGTWSRRITEEHRLVYLVDGDNLVVLQARCHDE